MTKGERFIICREHKNGSRGIDGHGESMSDMNSLFHDMTSVLHQNVTINAKGGDF
jgi:hypothetical protein